MVFLHIVNYVNAYGLKYALAGKGDCGSVNSKYATSMEQLAGAGFQLIGKLIRIIAPNHLQSIVVNLP